MEFFALNYTWSHDGCQEGRSSKNYRTFEESKKEFDKKLFEYQSSKEHKVKIESNTAFQAFYDNETRWDDIWIGSCVYNPIKFENEPALEFNQFVYWRIISTHHHEGWLEGKSIRNYRTEESAKTAFDVLLKECQFNKNYRVEVEDDGVNEFSVYYDNDERCGLYVLSKEIINFKL